MSTKRTPAELYQPLDIRPYGPDAQDVWAHAYVQAREHHAINVRIMFADAKLIDYLVQQRMAEIAAKKHLDPRVVAIREALAQATPVEVRHA